MTNFLAEFPHFRPIQFGDLDEPHSYILSQSNYLTKPEGSQLGRQKLHVHALCHPSWTGMIL